MKNKALFIVTLFFLLGCKQEQSSTDILTLSVDLKQSSLPDKVEETRLQISYINRDNINAIVEWWKQKGVVA